MRALIPIVALGAVLAVPPFVVQAQTPPQTPPAQPAPAPPRPAPAAPPPTPAAQPPVAFPEGAKVAFIDFQRIANESAEGKAATKKVQDLNQKKVAELNEKNKTLQATQQKLQQGLSVLSEDARKQLEEEITRQQRDIQRFTEDAQAEVQGLQQTLMLDFQRKVLPIVEQVANDRGLHMVFSADSGIVWTHRGLDVTPEVIKRFDAVPRAGAQAPPPQ